MSRTDRESQKRARQSRRIAAYHDGELRSLGRTGRLGPFGWLGGRRGLERQSERQMERKLERELDHDPDAREELEAIRQVGAWVRESADEAPLGAHGLASDEAPDLWPAIAARLAEADAERRVQGRAAARATEGPASSAIANSADPDSADPGSPVSAWSWRDRLLAPLVAAIQRPVSAAVAAVLVLGFLSYSALRLGDPSGLAGLQGAAASGVVEYLDPHGHSVMLLEDEEGNTIIWLMDDETSSETSRQGASGVFI